jgi:peptide deformylase
MNLIYYPNKLLNTPTNPVKIFDEALSKELDEMGALMLKYKGLGLSANQCGLSKSMFVFKNGKNEILKIINPKVIPFEGNISISEGCLSYPTIFIAVDRPETIELHYQNEQGEEQKAIAYDMDARIILHEMDHLKGIDFLSHTNRATRKAAQSKLRKLLS